MRIGCVGVRVCVCAFVSPHVCVYVVRAKTKLCAFVHMSVRLLCEQIHIGIRYDAGPMKNRIINFNDEH